MADAVVSSASVPLLRKIRGIMALVRLPQTLTTTVLTGLLAYYNSIGPADANVVAGAALSYFAVSAAGFAINDYFDIDIDRVNKPTRPLPSGTVTPREGLWVFGVSFAVGLVLPLFVGEAFATITLPNAVLVAAYSAYFKRHGGFVANVLMGVYAALVVLSGIAASGSISQLQVVYSVALGVYMVGVQLVMCVEDVEGDSLAGARTLAVRLGLRKALLLALVLMLAGLATLVATYQHSRELPWMVAILALNAYVLARLIASPTAKAARKQRLFMALSMILTVVLITVRGPGV